MTLRNRKKKTLPPLKAIRAKCLDCCVDSGKEVRLCPCGPGSLLESPEPCPLWPYRFGKNPNRKGIGPGGDELKRRFSKGKPMQTHDRDTGKDLGSKGDARA
jgi:hypothetical protein